MPRGGDSATISRLKIVVTSEADGVAAGLSKIAHSLTEIKTAIKGGFGTTLSKLASSIERLGQALEKIDTDKLASFANSIKSLRTGMNGNGSISIRFNETAKAAKNMARGMREAERETQAFYDTYTAVARENALVFADGASNNSWRASPNFKRAHESDWEFYRGMVFSSDAGSNSWGDRPNFSSKSGIAGLLGAPKETIDISRWFKGGVHMDGLSQFLESLANIRFDTSALTEKFKGMTEKLKGFFGQLKRIAMYRAIRWVLKTITEYISTGVKNLYQYSKLVGTSFAPTMDSLASSALFLKNSLGVVAGQLIETIAPVLVRVVDTIAEINNQIAMTIAYLRGESTYTKAVKVAQEYDDTLSHIRATLLGFDEINRLGGENGNSALDYSKMFVEDVVDKGKAFGLLTAVTLIGEALGAWKITGFLYDIQNAIRFVGDASTMSGLYGAVAKVAKITMGLTLSVAGLNTIWNGGKPFEDTLYDTLKHLLGMGMTAIGGYMVAGPAGLTIALTVTALLEIIKLRTNWGTEKDKIEQEFNREFADLDLNLNGSNQAMIWDKLFGDAPTIQERCESIAKGFEDAWNRITEAFATGWKAIQNLGKLFKNWWSEKVVPWWNENIAPWFKSIGDWFMETFKPLIDDIKGAMEKREKSNPLLNTTPNSTDFETSWGGMTGKDLLTWKKANQAQNREKVLNVFRGLLSDMGIVPSFASGGFPEDGLFLANHGEMVGRFANGKTAVVNNQEITAGIAQAVYQAIVDANGSLTSSPVSVSVEVDGETIARAVAKGSAASGRRAIARG